MSDCIEWEGGHWSSGYPYRCRKVSEGPGPKLIAVHRETWEKVNGPIPPRKLIMHTCDNRGCINIDHLRLGTPAENSADMKAKGRQPFVDRTHCPQGHPYDRVYTLTKGKQKGVKARSCSICHAASDKRRYDALTPEQKRERNAKVYARRLARRAER